MVLSGTLREFILADIFQLLAQQKITGKLVLSDGRNEGFVIFVNGLIASAEKDDERIVDKLFNFLVDMRSQHPDAVTAFFTPYVNNIQGLTDEIVHRNLMSQEDMQMFCEAAAEDITCSLFLWKSGSYRFNSLRNVETMIPAGITIPTENIVMEAMRRVDEWLRMQEHINSETVFVQANKANQQIDLPQNEIYLYKRIDGTSTVKTITECSWLTEYKVYEALQTLLQNNLILPLSPQLSRSIQAAIEKKERDKEAPPLPAFVSILTTVGISLFILFVGFFVVNKIVLSDINRNSKEYILSTTKNNTLRKIETASIQYRATTCGQVSTGALNSAGLLTNKDILPITK